MGNLQNMRKIQGIQQAPQITLVWINIMLMVICNSCTPQIFRLLNSHVVGMALARPYGFEINFVRYGISDTLFLDQLHDFLL